MSLSNAFREAVNEGNVRLVRIMMKDSLLLDPTFSTFSEMERAAANLKGLYDSHNGKPFIEDSSKWNDDYMNKLLVEVVLNFSHERIDHLKDIIHYLRPAAKKVSAPAHEDKPRYEYNNSPHADYQAEKLRAQENGDYRGAKIAAGAVVGAVAGGVVASAVGATIAGGVAAGAVVGGVATTLIVNGGK